MRRYLVFLVLLVSITPSVRAELLCLSITEDTELRPYETRLQTLREELNMAKAAQTTHEVPGIKWWKSFFVAPEVKKEIREKQEEYWERGQALGRLRKKIEILEFVSNLIRESRQEFNISIDEETLLLQRLESNPLWINSLEMIFAMRWHSADVNERNFWSGCFYYLVYGPDNAFFTLPFHHWMLFMVLDSRMDSMQTFLFRTLAEELNFLVRYYQVNPNFEERIAMSHFDVVLRKIRVAENRNIVDEYSVAVKTGVITPREVSMLSHVKDLTLRGPESSEITTTLRPVYNH